MHFTPKPNDFVLTWVATITVILGNSSISVCFLQYIVAYGKEA